MYTNLELLCVCVFLFELNDDHVDDVDDDNDNCKHFH